MQISAGRAAVAAADEAKQPRRGDKGRRPGDNLAGWLFVLPSVVLIVVFGLVPIVWGFVLSLQKASLISPIRPFAGIQNYTRIVHDPLAIQAAQHAVFYTFLFVPISMGLAMFVAIALNRKVALIRTYRLAVFIPVAVSTIATGVMFLWLFDKTFGLANFLLEKVGVGPFGWFDSVKGALPSVVIMTVWGWLGFDAIVYLAALQGIPAQLVEAAAVDGAGRWSTFRNVTLPLLGPASLLLMVWSTISAIQLFDEVFFVTRGGPVNATSVPVFYIFKLAFTSSYGFGMAGYAAALAYLLFVVIMLVTLFQFWAGGKMVHYSA